MAERRRSLVTVTTLRRLAFVRLACGLAAVGCSRDLPPTPTASAPIDERAQRARSDAIDERAQRARSDAAIVIAPIDASEPDAARAAPPPPPPPVPAAASFDAMCPEVADDEDARDAGPAPTPAPTSTSGAAAGPVVEVRFRTSRTAPTKEGIVNHFESRELKAEVLIPGRRIQREVFRMSIADPVQCCAKVVGESLVSDCSFSGIDLVRGRSITKREGDEVVVRWCIANASTRGAPTRGEERAIVKGATLRFVAPTPACDPKSIP